MFLVVVQFSRLSCRMKTYDQSKSSEKIRYGTVRHFGAVFVKEDREAGKVVQKPCLFKAKFHYTDPTGPARTPTDFVGDPHRPNGVSRRSGPQKVRAGPVGSV